MAPLFNETLANPVLWLLAFVPVAIVAQALEPEAHALLFVRSAMAIVRMAAGEAA